MFVTLITAYHLRSGNGITAPVGFTADTVDRAEALTRNYALVPITIDEAEEWIKSTGGRKADYYVFVEAANDDGGQWVNMANGAPLMREYVVEAAHDEWLNDVQPDVVFYGATGEHRMSPAELLKRVDPICYAESVSHYAYARGIEILSD